MIINKEFDNENFRIICIKFDMKRSESGKKMKKKVKKYLTKDNN